MDLVFYQTQISWNTQKKVLPHNYKILYFSKNYVIKLFFIEK